MECAKAAAELARSPACDQRPMIFLNIGEPDFTAPPLVREAVERALRDGRTLYTDATGLGALRERISGWYAQRFGLAIAPSRIVVTAGASAALQLACLALVDRDDEVLLPDPSYPCNRHFVAAAEGVPVLLPAGPAQRFQLDVAAVERASTPRTRGVLLASPSNPTGTRSPGQEMGRIVGAVRARRLHTGRRNLSRAEFRRHLRSQRADAQRPAARRRDLDQQLLEVLLHDRLAPRLDGLARSARRADREARAEPLYLPVDARPAGRAGLLRRRFDHEYDAAAPNSAPGATSSCRPSSGSVCACRCCPTVPSTPGPTAHYSPAAGTSAST
jgi:hypothetical protein